MDDHNTNKETRIAKSIAQALMHMRRIEQLYMQYELAEGFLCKTPDGHNVLATPEMLGFDPSEVFKGLEDVVSEINVMHGLTETN